MPTSFTESNNFSGHPFGFREKSVNLSFRSKSLKGTDINVSMFIKAQNFLRVILVLILSPLFLAGCFENVPEGMVYIPSGEFTIGTNEEDLENHALSLGLDKPWYADESPERRTDIPGFYIDRYEVTNLQYYIFCQSTDHKPPRAWRGQKFPEGEDNLPVTYVSFFDAAAYALWAGKRLPNEMEWEKAARGRAGFVYPWGDDFKTGIANLATSPRNKTGQGLKPVGSFPKSASPYGVHDMVGNVWEWVWDYYEPYPNNNFKTPAYDKKHYVVRGMSYMGVGHFSKKSFLKVVAMKSRASFREHIGPLAYKKDIGFRCAKDRPSFMERVFGIKPSQPEEEEQADI